jgi:hypothetical protein
MAFTNNEYKISVHPTGRPNQPELFELFRAVLRKYPELEKNHPSE